MNRENRSLLERVNSIVDMLLLVLAIILLVLFVPIRYRVHADKVGWDLNAGANVSWLLRRRGVRYL